MKRLILLMTGCAGATPCFEALLDIDRLEGGKGFQGTWLEKPDGTRLVVSYSPVPEYFQFIEKRVVVQGETYMPAPYEQHIGATHIRVRSIALAPGETAGPGSLPLPRLVTTRSQLAPGRWIEAQGTLRSATKHADDDWCDAVMVLGDGTEVGASMYITEMESKWTPLVGSGVTVMGKLDADGKKLIGPTAICAGAVRGCGMK